MQIKKEFTYNLQQPIEVSYKGEKQQALSITVPACTINKAKHFNKIIRLNAKATQEAVKLLLGELNIDKINNMREEMANEEKAEVNVLDKPTHEQLDDAQQLTEQLIVSGAEDDYESCTTALQSLLAGVAYYGDDEDNKVKIEHFTDTRGNCFGYDDVRNMLGLYILNFISVRNKV